MNVFQSGEKGARIVLLRAAGDHDLKESDTIIRGVREQTGEDVCLYSLKVRNWNTDLSPWEAPPVFGSEGFGGGAGETLKDFLELCRDDGRSYYIGGYSLSGLFALWAAYQTDLFAGVAAASPSVWFPGFTDYMREHEMRSKTVYLSLGDKEEKSSNPVMARVGDCIREGCELLKGQGVDCILEWNQGGHFKDAGIRTATAFAKAVSRSMG